MPYADPEKRREAKRRSASRRRAAAPEAERAYDRDQKRRRRTALGQAAGPPERATLSVAAHLGKKGDLREGFSSDQGLPGRGGPMLADYDRWTPLSGWWGFHEPLRTEVEERLWERYLAE